MKVRREITEPLARTLGWLASLRDAAGRIVCPDHRIEHTGKSACAAILAARLAELDPARSESWRDLAVQQGRRLVARLEREGKSPCHTFRPGRYDPFNCSNHVIDGGSCSDALAELVTAFGPDLEADEREAFARASRLHASTYLRYAVLDKGIPAQRAWGLTGLARAAALEPAPELERAALEAVGVLDAIQHADGSYPYHPLEWGAPHPGSSDVSSFYQSRVTAFLIFALEALGRDPRQPHLCGGIERGLRFLCALQAPDGSKVGLLEAKPWYWGATYEVASNPFDVYALARGWRLFGRRELGTAATRAFRAWVAHLGPEGRPASHHPGPGRRPSYQCPVFWAAHAAWAARAAVDLDAILEAGCEAPPGAGGSELLVTHFPDADLVRLEDARVCAWVRGRRPGFNLNHGSPHGAGLLRAVRRADGAELVRRCRLGGAQEGEWSGRRGPVSLGRGWRAGAEELRFSLWLARVALRRDGPLAALVPPWRTLADGVLAFAGRRVGSAFELAPELELLADGVRLRSRLARRSGEPLPASRIEREFRIDGQGLLVTEWLKDEGGARGLDYVVPRAASELERAPRRVAYRLA